MFDSKNNNQKKLAYASLAAELSVQMDRTFTSKQLQDKWSTSKPSNPQPTGNKKATKVPSNYDIMLEYWSERKGLQRESLLSTDDESREAAMPNEILAVKKEDLEDDDGGRPSKKQRSSAEALESGLLAIKDGLVSLGQSLAVPAPSPPAPPVDSVSLTDVLKAIHDQSLIMTQLLNRMTNANNSSE
ncbi:hypothetical protein DYB32_010882 [Aphanomyces invadans]|uniref:Myb/SANT-like domain-containing protein n=1 Tax=Aphanomyces invadans TaxID=157072 RepID=A0A3R6VD70_9STRA|nr:hypothetical protein DYB32_010882 [Aphanomyces invadans]